MTKVNMSRRFHIFVWSNSNYFSTEWCSKNHAENIKACYHSVIKLFKLSKPTSYYLVFTEATGRKTVSLMGISLVKLCEFTHDNGLPSGANLKDKPKKFRFVSKITNPCSSSWDTKSPYLVAIKQSGTCYYNASSSSIYCYTNKETI